MFIARNAAPVSVRRSGFDYKDWQKYPIGNVVFDKVK